MRFSSCACWKRIRPARHPNLRDPSASSEPGAGQSSRRPLKAVSLRTPMEARGQQRCRRASAGDRERRDRSAVADLAHGACCCGRGVGIVLSPVSSYCVPTPRLAEKTVQSLLSLGGAAKQLPTAPAESSTKRRTRIPIERSAPSKTGRSSRNTKSVQLPNRQRRGGDQACPR